MVRYLTAPGTTYPIPLDLTELMALYFSRGMMTVLKDTVFYESLESFFQKIKATLPAETIQYLEKIEESFEIGSKPYKQYGQLRDAIDRISEATRPSEKLSKSTTLP